MIEHQGALKHEQWDELRDQQWSDWRWQLRRAARSPETLHEYGVITAEEARDLTAVTRRFKTLVTPYYLSLIDRDDPDCPIRSQAIPHLDELDEHPSEITDPIGDHRHAPTSILVHRYPDRALLFPTYECPMFCRYCFRKEALNEDPIQLHRELDQSVEYLRAHPEIQEVILSGGDPLTLSTTKLTRVLDALSLVNVKRLRIHTRTPVTLPQRIDAELASALSPRRLGRAVTLITHFNHPREITAESKRALMALRDAGLTLLNQSVLLRGVNHSVATLKALSLKLGEAGVTPYYLHHTDLTRGTQRFRCSIDEGLELTRALRGQISGYLIPRYVIEVPGGHGKIELNSHAAQRGEQRGEWWLESPLDGARHQYLDPAYLAPLPK